MRIPSLALMSLAALLPLPALSALPACTVAADGTDLDLDREDDGGDGGGGGGDPDARSDRACQLSAQCQGEEDPAEFCRVARADCLEDPDCRRSIEECRAENAALIDCLLEHGRCEDGVFGGGLFEEGAVCDEVVQSLLDCIE